MDDSLADLRARLYACILEARRADASALLAEAALARGFNRTVLEVLEPTLRLTGERWNLDKVSLAQAYVAGKVAEDFLGRVSEEALALPGQGRPDRGTAVLGNAEDDYHGLGRRMVASFLRVEGWRVEDLGNDVDPSAMVDAAVAHGAQVIGVSAMMLTNARNILKVRRELDRRGLSGRIKLAVGGAVFAMRPELVSEVGGDGTAATAMDAPALFSSLYDLTRDAS